MTLVIGIGNPDRGDDAAGLAVARAVRTATAGRPDVAVVELTGDQLALLDAWDDEKEVYVIDAVWSGATPGTVYRLDAARPVGIRLEARGTHAFCFADVIELARALGRLPARVIRYGIEGAAFELGAVMSPEVEAAVKAVTSQVLAELEAGE